jgi:hypothetical protein
MNSRPVNIAAASILFTMLAGCASTLPSIYDSPGDTTFGEANRRTMMAQVVNPEPVYDGPMVTSGDHSAYAIERYNTDNVKEPENIRTTNAGVNQRGNGSGTSSGSN